MNFTRALSLTIVAAALTACGGNNNENNGTETGLDLTEFTGENAVASASTIDSLALEADFLTPEQAVGVLTGLSEIIKADQTKGSGKRLEYMRKFVDTYDILMSRSDEFTGELQNLIGRSGIDFKALFNQYRDTLSTEADGTSIEDGGAGATEVKAETPKTDSTATSTSATPAQADSI